MGTKKNPRKPTKEAEQQAAEQVDKTPALKLVGSDIPDGQFSEIGSAQLLALGLERARLRIEIAAHEEHSTTQRKARNAVQEEFDGIISKVNEDRRKSPTQTEGQNLVRLAKAFETHDDNYNELREKIGEKNKRFKAIPDEYMRVMLEEFPDSTLFDDLERFAKIKAEDAKEEHLGD